jgi:transcriptional regulator with XRE-family HTH domain
MARTNAQQKLGKKLKQLRLEADLSQEVVAERAGLDRTYVSGIERGTRNPSLRNIEKLAKALKVHVSDLVDF